MRNSENGQYFTPVRVFLAGAFFYVIGNCFNKRSKLVPSERGLYNFLDFTVENKGSEAALFCHRKLL